MRRFYCLLVAWLFASTILAQTTTSKSYDFIVVGGGTAGCALAVTLTQKGSVLLIERGKHFNSVPEVNTFAPWPQAVKAFTETTTTEGINMIIPSVLGGGSAIGNGIWLRESEDFISNVLELDVQRASDAYLWLERNLKINPARQAIPVTGLVLDNLIDPGQFADNGVLPSSVLVDGALIPYSIFKPTGTRNHAGRLFALAANTRLTIATEAVADRIQITSISGTPKAFGVRYKKGGAVITATLTNNPYAEVILCAGVYRSPQLLLLSGIGPQEALDELSIPQKLDLPVGASLYERPVNSIIIPAKSSTKLAKTSGSVVATKAGETAIVAFAGGEIASTLLLRQPFLFPPGFRTSIATSAISGRFRTPGLKTLIDNSLLLNIYAFPTTTGTVTLKTTNIMDEPKISGIYFKDDADVSAQVSTMKLISEILTDGTLSTNFRADTLTGYLLKLLFSLNAANSDPISVLTGPFTIPPIPEADAEIEAVVKNTVVTGYEAFGTCAKGSVVDAEFKVQGVEALRIVDASVFPTPTNAPSMATVMMLGRYVGQLIVNPL